MQQKKCFKILILASLSVCADSHKATPRMLAQFCTPSYFHSAQAALFTSNIARFTTGPEPLRQAFDRPAKNYCGCATELALASTWSTCCLEHRNRHRTAPADDDAQKRAAGYSILVPLPSPCCNPRPQSRTKPSLVSLRIRESCRSIIHILLRSFPTEIVLGCKALRWVRLRRIQNEWLWLRQQPTSGPSASTWSYLLSRRHR